MKGYGEAQCPTCGKIFTKAAPMSVTCGNPECKRIYRNKYNRENRHKRNPEQGHRMRRYSGEVYTNPPEKIEAIMAKYKNGITKEHIQQWISEL